MDLVALSGGIQILRLESVVLLDHAPDATSRSDGVSVRPIDGIIL